MAIGDDPCVHYYRCCILLGTDADAAAAGPTLTLTLTLTLSLTLTITLTLTLTLIMSLKAVETRLLHHPAGWLGAICSILPHVQSRTKLQN